MKKWEKVYSFAGIPVMFRGIYPYTERMCRRYEAPAETKPLLVFETEPEDLAWERETSEEGGYSDAYLESLALYRKLCEAFTSYGRFLFHCSAVALDGKAYLFTAPSGTGKSTHTRLWREKFGEKAVMVNDDKPLLEVTAEGVYVWGTPWNGKHHLDTNIRMPVAGICVLKRGERNEIRPLGTTESFEWVYRQAYQPREQEGKLQTLSLVTAVVEQTDFYELHCNISEEAAEVAYRGMCKG